MNAQDYIIDQVVERQIRRFARKKVSAGLRVPEDDLIQEGLLAAWLCVEGYDASKGASLRTWQILKAKCAMLDYARATGHILSGGRRSGRTERKLEVGECERTNNLDEYLESSRMMYVPHSREDHVADVDDRDELNVVLSGLSPRSREFATMRIAGMMLHEIGARFGLSEAWASNTWRSILDFTTEKAKRLCHG